MTPPMMRMVLVLINLTVWSSSWGATAMTDTVKVSESPISADDKQPFWLDNSHLLFLGFTGRERGSGTEVRLLNHGYYVWDIEQNTVKKDARFEHAHPECINAQTKAYVIRYAPDGKSWKRRAFVDGQEVPLPDQSWVNPFSCRVSTSEPSWVVKGRATWPLLEEHGYLDRGPYGEDSRSKEPILYYRTGVTKSISLGIETWRINPFVTYYPFANAYLLREWKSTSDAYSLWLLYPDGRVEQIFNPEGKAWTRSQGAGRKETFSWAPFHLTKRGVFLVEASVPKEDGSEKAGGYIVDGEIPRRVVQGHLSWGTVSPDGCKLAFFARKWGEHVPEDQRFKLQVIDVCQGGGHVN